MLDSAEIFFSGQACYMCRSYIDYSYITQLCLIFQTGVRSPHPEAAEHTEQGG